MAVTVAPRAARPVRTTYMALGALMAAIAIVGFWPLYFGPLVFGTLVQPSLLIHVHAAVFTGWLALFFLQAYFAGTGRIRWHLAVGSVGIWYGLLLIIVGLTAGVLRSAASQPGRAEILLLAITEDMLMFGGFFAAAVVYRRKPRLHRPLMVVAATSLLVAAVGATRIGEFLPAEPYQTPLRFLIWSSPLLFAMLQEFRTTRTVHPIYLIGLAVFMVRFYTVRPLAQTEGWTNLAHSVFAFARPYVLQ
jgi:hypothetical protein